EAQSATCDLQSAISYFPTPVTSLEEFSGSPTCSHPFGTVCHATQDPANSCAASPETLGLFSHHDLCRGDMTFIFEISSNSILDQHSKLLVIAPLLEQIVNLIHSPIQQYNRYLFGGLGPGLISECTRGLSAPYGVSGD